MALRAQIMLLDTDGLKKMVKNKKLKISKKEVEYLSDKSHFEIMKILIHGGVMYQYRAKGNEEPDEDHDLQIRLNWAGILQSQEYLEYLVRPLLGSDFALKGSQNFEFLYGMVKRLDEANEYEKCVKMIISQNLQ